MNEEHARTFAIRILDEFEDLLTRKNITVPSDERDGGVDEARLYGSEYSGLEEAITTILLDTASDTSDERGEPHSHTRAGAERPKTSGPRPGHGGHAQR